MEAPVKACEVERRAPSPVNQNHFIEIQKSFIR